MRSVGTTDGENPEAAKCSRIRAVGWVFQNETCVIQKNIVWGE